ncbi:flavin reductase family protein [Clostridium polynesiense]|uniref:flavin reductase family protein n=1 Tax=Clostridium polynesiense TaxID=1325933 RepID=UPI00058E7E85|nr:flavin reductase family protein [Clostridium polynesiense]
MALDFIRCMEKGMKYLSKQGAFLTVKNEDKINTMTISWGSIGYAWGRPVFNIMVRKSRYTHSIIEKADSFTLSVPTNSTMKKALALCGSKSGRDVNKYELANIELQEAANVESPIIKNCGVYFECKIIYKSEIDPKILKGDFNETWYYNEDYHTTYYGEIVSCYFND